MIISMLEKYRLVYRAAEADAGGGGDAGVSTADSASASSDTSTSPSSSDVSPHSDVSAARPSEGDEDDARVVGNGVFDGLFEVETDDGDLIEVQQPETTEKVEDAEPSAKSPPPTKMAEPTEVDAKVPKTSSPARNDDPRSFAPGQLAESLAANEAKIVDQLAQQEFRLSDEDVAALEENAAAHVPKLLARAHVKGMTSMLRQMERMVPAMITQHMQASEARNRALNAFYSKWPDLKPGVHDETVMKYAQIVRQANPQMGREEMFSFVGPLVMQALKITAQPSSSNKGNGSKPAPFVPARGGPAASPPQSSGNPWEGMNPDLDMS